MGVFSDLLGGAGKTIGGILNLAGVAGPGGEPQQKQAVNLFKKIQDPAFDYTQLTWQEIQNLATQYPQLFEAVVPEEFKQIVVSPETRNAQMKQLGLMEQTAAEGMPLQERIAAQRANESILGARRSADLGILSDLAQRGRLGAGDELAARMVGGQGAGVLAGELGRNLLLQQSQNRMGASQMAAGLAGNIRGQDVGLASQNAAIANRYNEIAANIRNEAAYRNALERARVEAANAAARQTTQEKNVYGRLGVQQQNLAEKNRLLQQTFANQMAKAGGQAGQLQNLAQGRYAQQAAKAQGIESVAGGAGGFLGGVIDSPTDYEAQKNAAANAGKYYPVFAY
jgi:hypothetical protein